MGTEQLWNSGLTVSETVKMTLSRKPTISFKLTVRGACCLYVEHTLSVHKSSYLLTVSWGWGVGRESTFGQDFGLPLSLVACFQNKLSFPAVLSFHWLRSREQPDPTLGCIMKLPTLVGCSTLFLIRTPCANIPSFFFLSLLCAVGIMRVLPVWGS